jgi:hypothetical protein
MMPTIEVEFTTDVTAKAERLWDILTDVQSWPEWQGTSYIKAVKAGPLMEGSTFVAELGGIKWNLSVTKAERPFSICWTGRIVGLGCIHAWEFHEEAGKTKAVTKESMFGWLLFLLYPVIKRRLQKYDNKWLADLKSKAESL